MVLFIATTIWRLFSELSEGGLRHYLELRTIDKEPIVLEAGNLKLKFLNPYPLAHMCDSSSRMGIKVRPFGCVYHSDQLYSGLIIQTCTVG